MNTSRLIVRSLGVALSAGVLAGVAWFAWPKPLAVDIAIVRRAPLTVSIDEEGRTRVRHVYVVSAPLAGKVLRTTRHVGDEVIADDTVVAAMEPPRPGFHDVRTHDELQAALTAAEAAVRYAEAEVRRMGAALDFARAELARAEALGRTNVIAARAVDKARFETDASDSALASAKAQLEVRRSERASAAARLIDPNSANGSAPAPCCVQIRAPVSGRVLRILQESEAVVMLGAPLIEIGDPKDLEVVVDLLSLDAVQVRPGAPVTIDGWGGAPLRGIVVRVDPAGFVKVSALGIEEQRVRTIINLTDPPESWSALGHEFRIVARIAVWSKEDALVAPVSALFRSGDAWAVYAVRNGAAQTTRVEIGRRTGREVEILSGLEDGDPVVQHPSDRIADSVAVAPRRAEAR
jgi:HlyD family secretion protein